MNPRGRFFSLFILLISITLVGAGCGGPSEAALKASEPVTLNMWRVFDDSSTMNQTMGAYQAIHPNVSFNYRELRSDEFEDELIRAFAEGDGPDIFSIHNTWIGEYESLIEPLPTSLTIPYSETRGTIKKETVHTLKEEPTISQRAVKSEFVDVVAKDIIRSYQANAQVDPQDRIFALPLAVDTLALYYNKDLLNAAGIPEPPKTWTQFQEQVTKLTKVGPNDTLLQTAASIGTGKNVERSFDILSLLMMQNGVTMTDNRGAARFGSGRDEGPLAEDSIRFYTDFANPLKQVYTWNEDQPDSFDAFISGKTAFFFGYSYHSALIKAASPKLNFSTSAVPQIDGGKNVNYANYWVETVAKSSDNKNWAWDFIQFATKEDQVTNYLKASKKPAARRALINSQIEDEDLSAFVSQTLTAESWYKGKNVEVAEKAFIDLIKDVLRGEELDSILNRTRNKVNQTL